MLKILLKVMVLSLSCASLAQADRPKLSVSKDAKWRKEVFCQGNWDKLIETGVDQNIIQLLKNNQAKWKQYCNISTFHCTNSKTLFGKNTGVCDDVNLCKDQVLQEACRVACVEQRDQKDNKTGIIESKLNQCKPQPVRQEVQPSRPASTTFNERRSIFGQPPAPAPLTQPSDQRRASLPPEPALEPQNVVGDPRRNSISGLPSPDQRRGSVVNPITDIPEGAPALRRVEPAPAQHRDSMSNPLIEIPTGSVAQTQEVQPLKRNSIMIAPPPPPAPPAPPPLPAPTIKIAPVVKEKKVEPTITRQDDDILRDALGARRNAIADDENEDEQEKPVVSSANPLIPAPPIPSRMNDVGSITPPPPPSTEVKQQHAQGFSRALEAITDPSQRPVLRPTPPPSPKSRRDANDPALSGLQNNSLIDRARNMAEENQQYNNPEENPEVSDDDW